MFDAWGIQYEALEKLKDEGCTEIRILEEEDDRIYSVSFEKLFKEGQVHHFGDGAQVFLPRSQWTITAHKSS